MNLIAEDIAIALSVMFAWALGMTYVENHRQRIHKYRPLMERLCNYNYFVCVLENTKRFPLIMKWTLYC